MNRTLLCGLAASMAFIAASAHAEYDPNQDPCLVKAEAQARASVAEEVKVPGHNTDLDRITSYGAYYPGVPSRDMGPDRNFRPVSVSVAMYCNPGFGWGCHGYQKNFRITKLKIATWFSAQECEVEEE